jgi:hypothetical protein
MSHGVNWANVVLCALLVVHRGRVEGGGLSAHRIPPYRAKMMHLPVALALLTTIVAARTQEAVTLPPPLRVEGAAIAKIDVATANINWEEATVADLRHLARLPALRRLQINPSGDDTVAWQNVPVAAFNALAALPALEELTVPYCCHLTPEHLRKLAGCARLAKVMFINENFTLDAEVAGALATWPALRSLDLQLIPVTSKGIAALAAAPHLEELRLVNCRGFDAESLAAVTGLTKLRSLAFSGVGQADMIARMRGDGTLSWALDAAAVARLAKMPALRELCLLECVLAPHVLAELPSTLTAMRLSGAEVDAAVVKDLRRLGGLRRLDLQTSTTPEGRDAAIAEVVTLLGALHLESFSWYGDVSADLCKAIGDQQDLRVLECRCPDDLAFLARLPRLARLVLTCPLPGLDRRIVWAPAANAFAALKASKSLREVVYRDPEHAVGPELVAELQRALGAGIVLRVEP